MKRFRKTLGAILRFAVALAILAYIAVKMDLEHFSQVLIQAMGRWPWIAGGLFCLFLCMCAGILRWKLILDAQDIRLPLGRVSAVFFIGHFFNAFMMGSTGGDVVKAVYAAKETHHKKTEAIATVIADRMIGLIALFILGGSMMALRWGFFESHPQTRPFCLLMLILIVVTAGGLFLLFRLNLFERLAFFQRLEQKRPFGPVLRKTYDSFYLCRTRPVLLSKTLALSFANHLLTVVACYCIGRSLQIRNPFLDYLTLFPIILSIASLPITPGGLGVREGAAVVLLGATGVPAAQALPLSLMVYVANLAWSVFGGVIFLFYTAGTQETIRTALQKIEEEDVEAG